MSHTRRKDQSVDAFSLPTDLLEKAKIKAASLSMTKSGYYRYCLAKDLGYSDEDSRAFAVHRAVLNSVEKSLHPYAMNESSAVAEVAQRKPGPVSYRVPRLKKLKTP